MPSAKDEARRWRNMEASFIDCANKEFNGSGNANRIADGLRFANNASNEARFYEVLDQGELD